MLIENSIILLPLILVFSGALIVGVSGYLKPGKQLSPVQQSFGLVLAPAGAFFFFITRIQSFIDGAVYTWKFSWLPSVGLNISFYVDSLSALFAILITFIGSFVVLYTGQYFKGQDGVWRFQFYLLAFMGAMLGLVIAGDVITLFFFWESTSIISYLLISYKTKDPEAQRSGYRALFITGGGGIALLAGLIFASTISGGSDFSTILSSGDILRSHDYYWVVLSLIAFGAFTKSAQFPAHIWLPGAMSAPTPASAYLHSATMVKAGIYLLARLNPALGMTETWFWLLSVVGMITMLVGAYQGLKQNDLKGVLAYSTVSQLGILVMLIGQDVPDAFKALVIGLIAHAFYKSSLFLLVGIIDHETGTRDLRRLGGLSQTMPVTFGVMFVAALSMAGLPPLFGFLAKETLLATAVHPSLPQALSFIFPVSTVIAGALMLAQAGMLVADTFLGKKRDESILAHEAPWIMILAPLVPTALSLVIGLLPETQTEAAFLASASSIAYGDKVKVSLKIWQGLNIPLLLSMIAISTGSLLFWKRKVFRKFQNRYEPGWNFEQLYNLVLRSFDKLAFYATRLQTGNLRFYLFVILSSAVIFVLILWGNFPLSSMLNEITAKNQPLNAVLILKVFALIITAGAALATIQLQRDFAAIIALSASGLGMSLLFVLEPAPDVALVQVVVDILSTVILILALSKLPVAQRRKAQEITDKRSHRSFGVWRDIFLAGSLGLLVTVMSFWALTSRPRESQATAFYEANAKTLVGAKDIVGAELVDFRAVDTLIEITVFSIAGLGVYTLLRFATRKHGDLILDKPELPSHPAIDLGLVQRVSSFIRVPAYLALAFSLILAVTHMMYGHDQPGDGFTAGVIVSLAVGLWYVVYGYEETRQRLTWIKPSVFISAGILLAIVNGFVAGLIQGNFLGNVDYGFLLNLPVPRGFHLSSSFIFELAIFLSVFGSAARILDSIGRPDFLDVESESDIRIYDDSHEKMVEKDKTS